MDRFRVEIKVDAPTQEMAINRFVTLVLNMKRDEWKPNSWNAGGGGPANFSESVHVGKVPLTIEERLAQLEDIAAKMASKEE